MPLLRALRQFTGYHRGDVFTCDAQRAAELLKKTPAIVELVDEAVPVKPKPASGKITKKK